MLKIEQKQKIKQKVQEYVSAMGSQNAAAKSLRGVSSATLSQILNENWSLIKDDMWRHIAAQIGFNEQEWQVVQTQSFKVINKLLVDAQTTSQVFAITGEAGTGKSLSLKTYCAQNKNAFLLQCNEYWNRKYFLSELLSKMGRDSSGLTVAEMMQDAVAVLKKRHRPIVILDEADKLSDQVIYFFITLYNELEDHCGLVLCATDHLERRITRGVKLNKRGYKEIYSRIGRKFIEIPRVSTTDVAQICSANGVPQAPIVSKIFNECEGDLRRVKRRVFAHKQLLNQENQAA
jgi:DNA transposition AAA+ family ATPase